ncbi:MAG: sialate O-acetylesterase [Planctomycetota bacterium]
MTRNLRPVLVAVVLASLVAWIHAQTKPKSSPSNLVRVFVFAGQSNMVGADSHAKDIDRFPPFAGFGEELPSVRFWYLLGREDMRGSEGWIPLQPVDGVFGPELSFARKVIEHTKGPIAIIKVASGGTTLGKDWNPKEPGGFELYPKALAAVRAAVAQLERQKLAWRFEGFVWHQGENDMFEPPFREAYAANLAQFIASWRRDLNAPELRFYLGELCTNSIWGMDHRGPMNAIARAQRAVAEADPLVDYVPTSHVSVEIGGDDGLHYHYGTLGQLGHGIQHAHAYLTNVSAMPSRAQSLSEWPYSRDDDVDLYVFLGHRNMEGERAFAQHLRGGGRNAAFRRPRADIAFRYSTGGGIHRSDGWEALQPAGLYDTFGPELSFGHLLQRRSKHRIAIAKFTHAGSQIVDLTPEGSDATERNLYAPMIAFVKESMEQLRAKGARVRLAGIVYHVGENDMSWMPHRRQAAQWLGQIIAKVRLDLAMPELHWIVSQQRPTQTEDLDRFDAVEAMATLAKSDPHLTWVRAFDPPPQPEQLVFDTAGVLWLGEKIADVAAKSLR